MASLRVVIADDSRAFRTNLCLLLNREMNFQLVGEAANGTEALDLVQQLSPDLLLLDLSMPVMSGYDVLEHLHATASPVAVIVLSSDGDYAYEWVMQRKAAGCISKHHHPHVLLQQLREILANRFGSLT